VAVALGVELSGKRGQFRDALHAAPLLTLLLVTALQIVALLARSEAWHVCVRAAGGTVARRVVFRAAGVGSLASVLNGSVGLATRIACLRRAAPDASPRVPALLAAEVPIVAVEIALAALFSFTLIGPLNIPWWIPLIAVAVMVAAGVALRQISERRRLGLWTGLAVMRQGRYRMIAFVVLAVCAQIARNWFVLRAIGVNVSVFDAAALLIATFTLGQLPIGPSVGAAAAVLILGAHGVAVTAAAGVLLTVTSIAGSVSYASWAFLDRTLSRARLSKLKIAAATTQA
jgi:uncharacterized membrane protein YbhN (UPF0104 family)